MGENYSRRNSAGTLTGTEVVPVWKDQGSSTNTTDLQTTLADVKDFILEDVSPAELDYLDGVTPGTVLESTAVVVDENKDVAGFRNITSETFTGQATQLADGGSDPVNAVSAKGQIALTGVITPAARATSKLTSSGVNVSDNDTVVINTTTYRFKNTMAQAYDVKIGADAATTLDNLKAAINGSGTEGVEYFAGTAFHPTVYATTNTDTTQVVVARNTGITANSYPTTTPVGVTLSWPDTTLGGGTGDSNPGAAGETVSIAGTTYAFIDILSETHAINWAVANEVLFGGDSATALDNLKLAVNGTGSAGTQYSTGTVANTLVVATYNTDTLQGFESIILGTAGNAYATTDTLANGGFGAATLTGGVAGTVGTAGEIRYNDAFLYLCSAENTATTANWMRASLTSLEEVEGRVRSVQHTTSGLINQGAGLVQLTSQATPLVMVLEQIASGEMLIITQTDAGTAGHTVTLVNGTFDGTSTVATFDAYGETLVLLGLDGSTSVILLNAGTVGLA